MVIKIEVFEDDEVWTENPRFVDRPYEKDDVVTIKIKDDEIRALGNEIPQAVRKYLKQWNAFKYYRDHPDEFVEQYFNVNLTPSQKEILNQIKEQPMRDVLNRILENRLFKEK